MLICLCSLAAALLGQTKPATAVADTPANRLAAARRYLKAVPPLEMVQDSVDRLTAQLPEDQRAEFREALARVLQSERIEKITLDAIVKHFTVREINALAAFYGSSEGRSISKKFSAYMADVMPAVQQELSKVLGGLHDEKH
ncbi:MAG: DUF2059 domain-containing protein [Bryobacterales bacterium]|nr:DUF2059 domain-containing protein [Bryobacterales bacterium]